jgi:hypothetical protein
MKKLLATAAVILVANAAMAETVTLTMEQIQKIENHIVSLNTQITDLTEQVSTQKNTIQELMAQLEEAQSVKPSDNADSILEGLIGGKPENPKPSETSSLKPNITTGDWVNSVDKNPLDDSTTVVSYLQSVSGQSAWGKKVVFVARCKSNKTEAYIKWGDYLGSDGSMVQVRVGKSKTLNQWMSHSTDSNATFVSQPIKLLRNIVKDDTNKLVLQTTPYNESPIVAVFDTTGAKESLSKLASTCNWDFK